MTDKKIVCLGGGIGTVNLIKGLKEYSDNITVVVSMADEGGSSGRLRRIYNIFPPGDLVSCMSALCNRDGIQKVLTYRFPGERYGNDKELGGHKLGNLVMVALRDIKGDFNEAITEFKRIFNIDGNFYPATEKEVSISAITSEGKKVFGEETIDLGKYDGKRILEKVFLHPKGINANPKAVSAINKADIIIAGPGDLYTTIFPVLIVPQIAEALIKSKAQKIFIVNVTNKPFETKGYALSDYLNAIKKHLKIMPFNKIVVNKNFEPKIPKRYKYSYVKIDKKVIDNTEIISEDLVDNDFPLYHNSRKLANAILKHI